MRALSPRFRRYSDQETLGRRLWILAWGGLIAIFVVGLTSLMVAIPLVVALMLIATWVTFKEEKDYDSTL